MSRNNKDYLEMKDLIKESDLNLLKEKFNLNDLENTMQDKYYHAEGNVWIHTKMVLDELRNSKEFNEFNDDEKFICFYSCLFHDIAKPICTKNIEGKIISPGHSKKGAIDTRIILWKNNVPFEIREQICNIINNHQVPFFAFNSKNKSSEYIAYELSWMLKNKLLISVAKADMMGRIYLEKQNCIDDIDLFKELLIEENCWENKKIFKNNIAKMKYFRSLGGISPDYDFFKEQGSKVIMMCALPASGKNTWIKENYPLLPTVSFDDMKEEMKIKENDNVGKAVHATIDKAKNLLRKRETFIWNATNINEDMRKKAIDLCYQYNAEIEIVYLETSYTELMHRNQERNSTLSNNKLENMLIKWSVPTEIESESIQYLINDPQKNKLKNYFKI